MHNLLDSLPLWVSAIRTGSIGGMGTLATFAQTEHAAKVQMAIVTGVVTLGLACLQVFAERRNSRKASARRTSRREKNKTKSPDNGAK
jgi:hypothetical protein